VPIETLAVSFVPAVVCIVGGNALNLYAVSRYHRTSRWGIRLTILGAGLLVLLPGIAVLVGAATGRLLWPSAIFGLMNIGFGLVFLEFLRRHWTDHESRPN
jgi:hypothetical protein